MSANSKLIVLITGANTGIGYHTATHLAKSNKFIIFIGARSQEKAEAAIQSIRQENPSVPADALLPLHIELTEDGSIAAAARHVREKFGYLDILINNAGIASLPKTSNSNGTPSMRERYNVILDTNVTGTACVTDAFIPLILKSTAPAPARRIVNVGTGLGSMTLVKNYQRPAEPMYSEYSISKSAINMLTLHTLRRLEGDKVTVIVASPGHCATNLNEGKGVDTPVNGGKYIADAATIGGFDDQNGKFYDKGAEVPW